MKPITRLILTRCGGIDMLTVDDGRITVGIIASEHRFVIEDRRDARMPDTACQINAATAGQKGPPK